MSRLPPAVVLLVVAPFCGEVMSTATPVYELALPWVLVFHAALYGCGALLVREAMRRWRLGLPGVIALGFAYGIYEEADLTRTWFDSSYVSSHADYSRVWDTSVLQAVHLTGFHAAVSIGASIAIVELLFPARRGTAWAGARGLAGAGAALASVFVVTLAPDSGFYATRWPQMGVAFGLAVGLVWLAPRLPRRWPAARGDRRMRALAWWVGATTALHFACVYTLPETGLPSPLAVLIAGGIPVVAVLAAPRFMPARREEQLRGLVVGLLAPLALLNLVLLQPATVLAAMLAALGLRRLSTDRAPGLEGQSPGADAL